MAKQKILLPEDPRWNDFCDRFVPDPTRFVCEVLLLEPTFQQIDLYTSVAPSRSRTSVASGHGTGKTSGTSHLVLWHMLCFPMSVTLITANDLDQMKATMWKEIATNVERIRANPEYSWLANHIEILANATMRIVGFEKTWFVESKTANAKTANKLAGRHGKWLLIIADEASTIPDEVLITLSGALTEEHNRMLMNSQPTRNAGFFWRTHHDLSIENGGEWNALVLNSIVSPLVSDEALRGMWDAYDDDERRVRLLGQFPQDSSKHMMSLKVSMSLYKRGRIIQDNEPYGYLLTSDIASGEGLRDKSAIVAIRVIGYGDIGPDARRIEVFKIPKHTNNIRSNKFAGVIMGSGDGMPDNLKVVDSGGLGINVCQDLEDAGQNVHRVNWGNPCFMNKNKDRYLNLRAQAMHQCARACKEGRVSILTQDYKKDILTQSSRIPKAFTEKGRIKVPPKGSAEWEGMKSPDLWDAICFAFLENVYYTAIDHSEIDVEQDVTQRMESTAERLLGDIE